MERLRSLSAVQQRKAAAILGGLVADAATAPLHWIYDQSKVAALIKEKNCDAFYPTSQCPFYTIPTGNNSTYGDQLYVTLKCIAENKGFDASKLADAIFATFGPGTVYEKARTEGGSPLKGPWTNHCIKIFVANRENGDKPEGDANSKDPDGFCKAVAVTALSAGKDTLKGQVTECVNTCQLNPMAVDFALGGCCILDELICKGELSYEGACITPEVAAAIKEGREKKGSHVEVAKAIGLACAYPASFKVGIHGIATATSYAEAVKQEIAAGGDNCSRVMLVGSVCAAKYGLDAIPEEWLKKYDRCDEVIGYIETLVQL